MSTRPPAAPKWLRERVLAERRRAVIPPRCPSCGRPYREGHGPSCPTRFANLETQEQITASRLALMIWADAQQPVNPAAPSIVRDFANGLTARAVELLGAETW